MEGSSEVSGSGLGITPGTTTPDQQGPHLPGYFPYLSLVFRWIATLIILMMAGWVVFTIKTTRKLHKPHNIFVANLMITDIISAVLTTVLTSIMMVGYVTGVGDFINCRVFVFLLFPIFVIDCTYLMISVNQVIAIAFPYKHKKIMKPRTIFGSIPAAWLLSILLSSRAYFSAGYIKMAQYGTCISEGSTFIFTLLGYVLPVFTVSLIVIILNIYLSYKAYQVQREIQEESRLSGTTSNEVKEKQATIKAHLKPMKTLLVVVLGSAALGLIFPLLYIPARILKSPVLFESTHIVITNVAYLLLLLHPFVYGLYYKQVREPMMRVLKRVVCKNSAVVAPQPRRTAWM
ncbi:rhodopsin, GQ-coupled-like [Dysidea avara]|uniref:rhodopsin, GQ-coupled-like n=1 Tax=Dysidea avara TaxID=196820 RepID=UPI0033295780